LSSVMVERDWQSRAVHNMVASGERERERE
jgi:hypothetical protein